MAKYNAGDLVIFLSHNVYYSGTIQYLAGDEISPLWNIEKTNGGDDLRVTIVDEDVQPFSTILEMNESADISVNLCHMMSLIYFRKNGKITVIKDRYNPLGIISQEELDRRIESLKISQISGS